MRMIGLVLVLACAAVHASAQSALKAAEGDAALPAYDVSVIRAAAGMEKDDRHVWTRLNTLDVKNMPLLNLLESAFDVPRDMIVGLPDWAKHERLDIQAKTLDADTAGLRELTVAQRRAMMQALFADRLGLKWHYETRVLPSYDLVVASGGAKLKPTVATGHNSGVSVNDTRFRLTNVPVPELAVVLADKLGRPVVDKTGLTGRYDMVMEWSADLPVASANVDAPPPLFTALHEQLGLKLESGKDPVQVFVIDRLTPPVGN
ncbi:TIGR03435 family protein [Granulicella sp. 5B5]|uniref:TIGR03435 family protein n=1 Tax=Granulicella sp. 5B5 TaxID=1617967 RepID=UPI0015F431C2|nr:TIGR03435 family protein [Granulicella sp. 5B5]